MYHTWQSDKHRVDSKKTIHTLDQGLIIKICKFMKKTQQKPHKNKKQHTSRAMKIAKVAEICRSYSSF